MSRLSEVLSLRKVWFPVLFCVIGAVSLFDTYLIVCYQDVIHSTEENPVGLFLLQMGSGSVEVFVRTKLAGTVVVLTTLYFLWRMRSRIVVPVTTSVASWQTGLFFYLTMADTALSY